MARLSYLLVLAAVLVAAHGESMEHVEIPPQPKPPKNMTTLAPVTTSTLPPTTTPITTTTSAPPPAPNTTTTAPPTPPITTTTPKPTTTPAPTPKPTPTPPTPPPPTTPVPPAPHKVDPKVHKWTVVNNLGKNTSCIVAQMALQIEIPYLTKNNKTYVAYVDVSPNATATGSCGNTTQDLKLTWEQDYVQLTFTGDKKTYVLSSIEVYLVPNATDFPDAKDTSPITFVHKHQDFNTTVTKSYKCDKEQSIQLNRTSNMNDTATFHVSQLRLQAFQNTTNGDFVEAIDCAPIDTPDIVPIAAGCALAALIIIVLLAFLLGRRRAQARGYLSMFTQTKREEDYIPMKNLSCFN